MRNNSLLQKTKVLIVDDDATICLLMQEALSNEPYTVTAVNNGFDALQHIKHQQPDLVLLDVTMPGMDGFEVCADIRRLYGDIKISIVMVTALEDAASIEKSYDVGATDFISKPINWDTFPYRVQYLIKARNAIIEIQQHKVHLEYMEDVSRIITQNKDKNTIMQETMFAMLDIFSADRVLLLKPDQTHEHAYTIDNETTNDIEAIANFDVSIFDTQAVDDFRYSDNSEYPVISRYDSSNPPPPPNPMLNQQMLTALHLQHTQNWYLIIQQNTRQMDWTINHEETFYKIALRLTNMLSRYLLAEELSRSDTLLKQAQKIGHLGSWHWSAASGKLTWSDEVYHIYGYLPHNYTPDFSKYFDVAFEEDVDRLDLLNNIINNINSSYQIDHRVRNQNNEIRWTHEQCVGSYDDSGTLLEINGIVQDITEARIKKEQDVHNSKMEAIGQLTSGVAHDFGNLMTVAKGNLELLEESLLKEDSLSSDDIELLDDTRSAVNDSVQLTRQLLSFSRKKSIAPAQVNISDTFNRFNTLFRKTLGDMITMSVDIENSINNILVDPSQFESSLLNIIINARNAMPRGGEIQIHAYTMSLTHSQEMIRNAENSLGDECICISIEDNGTGMNEDVLKRAIEPFYTTQINKGTGLGLSMVYGFIKQSGGELIILSTPEKGTTVQLQFPIYDGPAKEEPAAHQNILLHDIQATVLIVEDRPSVRKFAVRCLSQTGFTILQADDAASARKLLKANHVDLMFSDIVMPGDMDGYKLANWASQEYPDLKILLTTAMEKITPSETVAQNKEDSLAGKNNKHTLLMKPYSKNELVENIVRLLKLAAEL